MYSLNTRALQVVTLLIGGCGLAGSTAGQTWSAPQFVTNGSETVALATNGSGTSAILFWLNGPGLMSTVGKNGVWSAPVTLTTATSVGNVAVAPNGDVLTVWSFHTNNTTTPIETQAAFYSGGHWGNTITVTTNGSATPSSSLARLGGLGFDGNSNATLVWEQLTGGSCALVTATGNSSSGFGPQQVLGNTCLGWVQLAVTSNGQALAVQGGATLEVAPVIATSRASNGVWSASIDVATLLPGSKTWNQNGPSSGLVAIGPGEAVAVVNPSISVATELVP